MPLGMDHGNAGNTQGISLCVGKICLFSVLGVNPGPCVLAKHSTTELRPLPRHLFC